LCLEEFIVENLHEDELSEQIIDLGAAKNDLLTESWLRMFGGVTKMILGKMFGTYNISPGPLPNFQVRGTKSEIASYARALGNEKQFMVAAKKFGLDDPRTYKSKIKLDKAIKNFEKTTGLIWPFKS
jgi:hypothetical protein